MTVGLIATSSLPMAAVGPEKTRRLVDTPYGIVEQVLLEVDGITAVAIRRSTGASMRPPHAVNYRANMFSFAASGVRAVIGTNIVGSLRHTLAPGSIVLPDQFLDLTRFRESTIFDAYGHRHVDVAEPYCGRLRDTFRKSSALAGVDLVDQATYVAVEGPRFETRAEVRAFAMLGGDVVGMTGATEAIMAREMEICYASAALVSNYGAGIGNGGMDAGSMVDHAAQAGESFRNLVRQAVALGEDGAAACGCGGTSTTTLPTWRDPMLDLTFRANDRQAQWAD
jgi:5'-methylthioadenosine phosphorylase